MELKRSSIICILFGVLLVVALCAIASCSVPEEQQEVITAEPTVRLYFCSESTARSGEKIAKEAGVPVGSVGGNNDCILLEYKNDEGERHFALIDTGAKWETDGGSTVAVEWLRSHGVERLDWMLITHQHADHQGDALNVLRQFDVGTLYMKHFDGYWVYYGVTDEKVAREMLGAKEGEKLGKEGVYYLDRNGNMLLTRSSSLAYANIMKVALSNGTRIVGPSWAEVNPESPICASASPTLKELGSWSEWLDEKSTVETPSMFEPFDETNTRFSFGPAEIEIINWQEYDANGAAWSEASKAKHETVVGDNQNSLGVVIQIGDTRAFLAGDIESCEKSFGVKAYPGEVNDEDRIADVVGDVDFYKAAHHGYDSSTSEKLVSKMLPETCMITNMVGQASDEVIERLKKHGCACMYVTEDPVETVVELAPDAVRMMRASEGWWRYETPYHEITVRDGIDGSVLATLEVRDGHDAEWPDDFTVPEHEGWQLVGGVLPELPNRVRTDSQMIVEYERVS